MLRERDSTSGFLNDRLITPSVYNINRRPVPAQRVRPLQKVFVSVVVKLLAITILIIAAIGPSISASILPSLLKFFGGLLFAGLIYHVARGIRVPVEAILYFSFCIWALGSALVVAVYFPYALREGLKIFQIGILFAALVVAHVRHPDLRIVMYSMWGLGFLFGSLAFLKPSVLSTLSYSGGRLSVLGENPNFTGQIFVFGMFAALYLLQVTQSPRMKFLLTASFPIYTYLLLLSGSRKMLIALIVLGTTWVLMSQKLKIRKKSYMYTSYLVIFVIATIAFVTVSYWEETPMAKRWALFQDQEDLAEGPFGTRQALYMEGWKLFLQHPVAGVGLQNQVVHLGVIIHSEFLDVLASTGIIGALIYFSLYIKAYLRARRVCGHGSQLSENIKSEWQAFRSYAVVIVWLMVGFPRYNDFLHIVIFGSFIGYFVAAELNIRKRKEILPHLSHE